MQAKYEEEKKKIKEEFEKSSKIENLKLLEELRETKEKMNSLQQKIEEQKETPKVSPKIKPQSYNILKAFRELNPSKSISQEEYSKETEETPDHDQEKDYLFGQIIYIDGHTYKLMANTKSHSEKITSMTISLECIDTPSIKVKEETLDEVNLKQIMLSTNTKGTTPHLIIAQGCSKVEHVVKYEILPFIEVLMYFLYFL